MLPIRAPNQMVALGNTGVALASNSHPAVVDVQVGADHVVDIGRFETLMARNPSGSCPPTSRRLGAVVA